MQGFTVKSPLMRGTGGVKVKSPQVIGDSVFARFSDVLSYSVQIAILVVVILLSIGLILLVGAVAWLNVVEFNRYYRGRNDIVRIKRNIGIIEAAVQPIGFSVYANTTQNIPTATLTILTEWTDTAGVPAYDDTGGAFDFSTGIFTAAVPGRYMATGSVCWVGTLTGTREAHLNTNGTSLATVFDVLDASNATTFQCNQVSQIMDLNLASSVWLEAIHDSGVNETLTARSRFSIERIAPESFDLTEK